MLLYSWSDRKLLEFLHARSYPPTSELADLYARIPEDFVPRESVMATSEEADESETAAFRQLVNHGALLWSPDDRVARVPRRRWRKDYEAQRDHRLHQIEDMVGFAQSGGCRMHGLVRYFSPAEAGTERCGLCDHCAPEATVSRQFREPTDEERAQLERALAALVQQYGMTPKRLHDEVFAGREIDRDRLERYVDALTRAGLVRQETDSFEKGGRVIMFQRLFATGEGSVRGALDDAVLWLDLPEPRAKAKRGSAEKKSAPKRRRKKVPDFDQEPAAAECYEALRTWRAALAEENGMPAYHIASNAVLEAISVRQPDTERGLLDIKGMGPVKVEAYGEAILSILQDLRLAE